MNSEEQSLIDGLFTRLRDAESQTAPRDADAEAQINRHLVQQPAAPYYMAQAMLIQEAAIKRLDQRVKELEAQLPPPATGCSSLKTFWCPAAPFRSAAAKAPYLWWTGRRPAASLCRCWPSRTVRWPSAASRTATKSSIPCPLACAAERR